MRSGQGGRLREADSCRKGKAGTDQHCLRSAERRQHGAAAQSIIRNPAGQTAEEGVSNERNSRVERLKTSNPGPCRSKPTML
jgi:hypothetical protein